MEIAIVGLLLLAGAVAGRLYEGYKVERQLKAYRRRRVVERTTQ